MILYAPDGSGGNVSIDGNILFSVDGKFSPTESFIHIYNESNSLYEEYEGPKKSGNGKIDNAWSHTFSGIWLEPGWSIHVMSIVSVGCEVNAWSGFISPGQASASIDGIATLNHIHVEWLPAHGHLNVNPTYLNFGDIGRWQYPQEKSIEIRNDGEAPVGYNLESEALSLPLLSISVSGTTSHNGWLDIGDMDIIYVTVNPDQADVGDYTTHFKIVPTDPEVNSITVTIQVSITYASDNTSNTSDSILLTPVHVSTPISTSTAITETSPTTTTTETSSATPTATSQNTIDIAATDSEYTNSDVT
ncbi:MAG: hypothetical protein U9O96_06585 [Candidatus Thermoplasmatota archaeon]|nr:hypothetical protein [Candidatus Thermoplasmatota archaeon]